MCGGSAPIAEECCVVVEVVVDFGALAAVALVVVLALDVEFEAEAISYSVPKSTVSARRPSTTNKRKVMRTSAKCPPTVGRARNGSQLLPLQNALPVAVSYQSERGYELRPDATYLCT